MRYRCAGLVLYWPVMPMRDCNANVLGSSRPASGRVRLGFSGRVLKWVLLVWMEMGFSSYWVGVGWAFTRCGLGVGWGWMTRESSLPVSQPRRRLRPRPPVRHRSAAPRRLRSSPAILPVALARPQGAGRPPRRPSLQGRRAQASPPPQPSDGTPAPRPPCRSSVPFTLPAGSSRPSAPGD